MIATRSARARATSSAVFVRLVAFIAALVSVIVVPWSFVAAVLHHTPVAHAVLVSGISLAVAAVTTAAARSYDPLRG